VAQYAVEMSRLWSDLSATLSRLDRLAGEPDCLDGDGVEHALRRLQYALHLAAEQAYGVEPPESGATAHAELAAALACARDATAEVAEAVAAWGAEGVQPLLHEWRGALFRVRLARLRLTPPNAVRPVEEPTPDEGTARPLAAFLLALLGALAFVAGATLGVWPLWGAGLLSVGGSLVVYRP
jgi:hypothetical protein